MAHLLTAQNKGSLRILDDAVCVIGAFDGVHLGHQALIGKAFEKAKSENRRCVVITFDIDPDELFKTDALKITSNRDRISLLEELCDDVAVVGFDEALASLGPEEFLNGFFIDSKPHDIFVGDDFHYGCKGAGDIDTLARWGRENDVRIHPVGLVCIAGHAVKSTYIRSLLQNGDIKLANQLLGRPYSVKGPVIHGRGDGKGLGFQTANLSIPSNEMVLCDGVYGGYAIVDGKRYKTAISLGVPPTFEDASDNVEAHILDFDDDIYGQQIELQFIEYIRPLIKFDDVNDLIATVNSNIEYIKATL